LDESLALLYHNLFFKHQVKVIKRLSPALPPIKGRYSDLNQGFWNLLENAVEAMENSPIKELTLDTKTDGNQIRVIIQDSGCGVPEQIKAQLFQPFLTTKGGKHPGLGLFISKILMQICGASFEVFSREGETRFTIYLPTSAARGN
jgi:two-component system NtrC family sensor kinase